MAGNHRASLRITVVICAVLTITTSPLLMGVATAALPPRPDPSDDLPAPGGGSSLAGAQIVLHAAFSADWPWSQVHWQDLWTVVEWQDPEGKWHVVEGWQGNLDKVASDDSGLITGEKAWWVYGRNLGQGPFRWLVYKSQGGKLIASSDVFDLPGASNQSVIVEVSLTP